MDNIKTLVNNVTDVFVSPLALAIVASLLVGPSNMAFLGDVANNVADFVSRVRPAAALALAIILGLLHIIRKTGDDEPKAPAAKKAPAKKK